MLPVLLASETFEESWSVAVWTDSPRASGAPVLVRSGHPRGEERPFSLGAALGGFLGVGLSSCLPGGLPPCLGNLSDKALGSGKEIVDAKPWHRETVAVVSRTEASAVKRCPLQRLMG